MLYKKEKDAIKTGFIEAEERAEFQKQKKESRTLYLILAAALALIAVASVAGIAYLSFGQEAGTYAEIYQNGVLIRTVLLDGSEDGTFTVCGEDGSWNTIAVTDGMIAVTDASCPDLLCVHMGASGSVSLPIVCLPNGLVIQVKTNSKDENAPDAVSY